jgi:hypothetical protein
MVFRGKFGAGVPVIVLVAATATVSSAWGAEKGGKLAVSLGSVGEKVYRKFAEIENSGFDNYLRTMRPNEIPPDLRKRVIANLPKEGHLNPSAEDRSRLSRLQPIFSYHDRASMIENRLIDMPQALVGLHASFVLLIARNTMNLLTTEELQAAVAHEMGHFYSWDEYQVALQDRRFNQLQELELQSDAIAVITLVGLGLDPSLLITSLKKLTGFNQRLGASSNVYAYVRIEDRTRFIEAMIEMVRGKMK